MHIVSVFLPNAEFPDIVIFDAGFDCVVARKAHIFPKTFAMQQVAGHGRVIVAMGVALELKILAVG